MSAKPVLQLIYFEVNQRGYAVDAAELTSVAVSAPQLHYAGLPDGVLSLLHWNGKILPVLDVFGGAQAEQFLISIAGMPGRFEQFALPIHSRPRVFLVEGSKSEVNDGSATKQIVFDSEGVEARYLDLKKVAAIFSARFKKGQKNAA